MSWPLVRLSEVAEINPRPPKGVQGNQTVSFLPMAAVSESGVVDYEEERTLEEVKKGFTYFERGDFLIAKITPCFENGKAALVDDLRHQIGFGSTEFHVIRPKCSRLHSRYLYHFFWNKEFRFYGERKMQGAAGQKRISTEFLKSYQIPLPPLEEQKRIAAILDKADAIRRKRQKAIQLTDTLLKSVFLDMFGDPVANPKGWPRRRFSDLALIDTRMIDPKNSNYIDLLHIGPDVIERETGKILSPKTAKEEGLISGKYLFDSDHILYTKIRPYLQKVAMPTFEGICSADVYPILPIQGMATKEFLWAILISPAYIAYFNGLPDRANIPKINMKEMNAYQCVVPPIEDQERFSSVWMKIMTSLKNLEKSQKESSDLFASLTKRAFPRNLIGKIAHE